MNALAPREPVSMGLLKTVYESQHLPGLFAGGDTHDPALRTVGQLVRHGADDTLITNIITAALPSDYAGDTLKELPGMIISAREAGLDATTREPKTAELVLRYIKSAGITLFKDSRDRAFMTVPQEGGGALNYLLSSELAKAFIQRLYYREQSTPLAPAKLREVVDALVATALFDGEKHDVSLRVGRTKNAVYVDLGRADGLAVEIVAGEWRTVRDSPVRFERHAGFGELPVPVEGGSLRALQELLQLDETNFALLVAYLLICLRPGPTFMCLIVEGDQGSGKSFLCEIIKRIIDPNVVLRLRLPKTEQDLMIQANAYYLLSFDNASGVVGDISDTLCSLATGGGFAKRKLYFDDALSVISLTRAFIINGIGDFVHRPDLMDRAIPLKLPPIVQENRKTEEQLRADFDAILPGVLGALYSIVAEALKNEASVETTGILRMADCAKWLRAAEPATEFPEGTLLPLIEKAQTEMVVDKIADLPLVMLLRKHLAKGAIEDTIGTLYITLLPDKPKGDRTFPGSSSHLSKELKRLKPALAKAEIFLEIGPHRREGRLIQVWRKDQDGAPFRKLAATEF